VRWFLRRACSLGYCESLINSRMTQCLPDPAWPLDGQGIYDCRRAQPEMDRNMILRHVMLTGVFSKLFLTSRSHQNFGANPV
jgi:hypothetical protein